MKFKEALLVVDVQNDFTPKGALAVPKGDEIIPALNKYIKLFSANKLPVFATRDWHPKETKHFKQFGGVWPPHCIQNTKGARFHPALKLPTEAILLYKGMDPGKDSYSAFQALDANGAELLMLLNILGVEDVYIGGLATDYCVKFSAIDAVKNGIRAHVLLDAIKGVNMRPSDSESALKEMLSWGAKTQTFDNVSKRIKRKGAR